MPIAVATSAASCEVVHFVSGICGIDVFERRDWNTFELLRLELDQAARIRPPPDVPTCCRNQTSIAASVASLKGFRG